MFRYTLLPFIAFLAIMTPFISTQEDSSMSEDQSDANQFPTAFLNTYVVDIHFPSGHLEDQAIVHHFCKILKPDYIQCDLYDRNHPNATLIGVELIISNETFAKLPAEEKILWYSHAFEAKAGLIVFPELSAKDELATLKAVIDTYAKSIDFFPASNQTLPTGAPRVVFGLQSDSQINTTLAKQMDELLNLGTTYKERAKLREDLEVAPLIPGAGNEGLGACPDYVVQISECEF